MTTTMVNSSKIPTEAQAGTIRSRIYRCVKCKHRWISRLMGDRAPKLCPHCKNPNWQIAGKGKGARRVLNERKRKEKALKGEASK